MKDGNPIHVPQARAIGRMMEELSNVKDLRKDNGLMKEIHFTFFKDKLMREAAEGRKEGGWSRNSISGPV